MSEKIFEFATAVAKEPMGIVVIALMILLTIALTGLKVLPMITRRLITVELKTPEQERHEERRHGGRSRSVDEVIRARLTTDLLDKINERGARLHKLDSELTALLLRVERVERDMVEMKLLVQKLTDQYNEIAVDFAEMRADVRYTKEKTDEMCERQERIETRLGRLEGPMEVVATWVAQRQLRRREDTPTPRIEE